LGDQKTVGKSQLFVTLGGYFVEALVGPVCGLEVAPDCLGADEDTELALEEILLFVKI
jgi:hypothetical protein